MVQKTWALEAIKNFNYYFRVFEDLTAKYGLNPEEKASFYNLLDLFIAMAKANNIPYFLYGGSLLGWHCCSGMLPWDDDIDMAMTKADADKVVDIVKNMVWKTNNVYNHNNQGILSVFFAPSEFSPFDELI